MKLHLSAIALLLVVCGNSRVNAMIITYEFSGLTFEAPLSTNFSPTTMTGRITWDTSVQDLNSFEAPDSGWYQTSPSGPVGMSLTTSTGLTFATNKSSHLKFLVLTQVQGSNYFRDQIVFDTPATLPSGWTAEGASMKLTLWGAPDGSLLGGSDAIPHSLPTFTFDEWNASDLPPQLDAFPGEILINMLNYAVPGESGSFTSIAASVTSLEHIGSSDAALIAADNTPVVIDLAGGSGSTGGLSAELTTTAGSTLSANYSALTRDQLPTTDPFSSANFVLDIPGDRLQFWDLELTGTLAEPATLTFHFDSSLLTSSENLGIWHFKEGSGWEFLGGTIEGDTITVQTDSFSPFALANAPLSAVPEPSSLALLGSGLLGLCGYGWRRRQKRQDGTYRKSEVVTIARR